MQSPIDVFPELSVVKPVEQVVHAAAPEDEYDPMAQVVHVEEEEARDEPAAHAVQPAELGVDTVPV